MNLTTVSKLLALILRHKPEELGLTLDEQGWCNVDKLVKAFNTKFDGFTFETLEEIVKTDNKGRYSFNDDKTFIRAVQGHSTKLVNIDFEEVEWSSLEHPLYHGTAKKYLQSIINEGILPKSRNYVHLSSDIETAKKVGSRHGRPAVLRIDSEMMHDKGIKLFRSENGVYLVDKVPNDCFIILAH